MQVTLHLTARRFACVSTDLVERVGRSVGSGGARPTSRSVSPARPPTGRASWPRIQLCPAARRPPWDLYRVRVDSLPYLIDVFDGESHD